MNWLGLKNSSKIGIWGGNLIIAGLVLAGITSLIFIVNLCNQELSLTIDSEKWGHFGDFIGGTWGVLLTAGSAMLIVETIRKQDEHEQVRSFESKFFNLLDYQRKISEKLFEGSQGDWIKSSLITLRQELESHNPSNQFSLNPPSSETKIKYFYLRNFGIANNYSKSEVLKILNKVNNDNLSYFHQPGPEPLVAGVEGKISFSPGKYETTLVSNKFPGILTVFFKHLFGLYLFIENSSPKNFSSDQKKSYGRMVNAFLSIEEQALILMNSQTQLGEAWRTTTPNKNELSLLNFYSVSRNIPSDYFIEIDLEELRKNSIVNINNPQQG
ncbi:MAG TPA: putative phage abortive infection protein [Catalimonadaceae bacterium]|nr:putative phage abortive infection protein [Catalimonadaceae bacterium]